MSTILNPTQIAELNGLVYTIQQENKRKVEDILADHCSPQQTSVLNLYHLTMEQCVRKQNTIDNLCHFTTTVMASLDLLWQQKQARDQELIHAQTSLQQAQTNNAHLQQLLEAAQQQNQQLQHQLRQTQEMMQKQQQRKQYYQNQQKMQVKTLVQGHQMLSPKQKYQQQASTCLRSQLISANSPEELQKMHNDSQQQLLQLQNSNLELSQRISQMEEERELARMEIQLAEIALKDALSYKEEYKSMIRSNSRLDPIDHKDQHTLDLDHSLGCFSVNQNSRNKCIHNTPPSKSTLQRQMQGNNLRYFASTPCLLLNQIDHPDSQDENKGLSSNFSHSQLPQNPFRKKAQPLKQQFKPIYKGSDSQSQDLQLGLQSQEEDDSHRMSHFRPRGSKHNEDMISRLNLRQSTIKEQGESDVLARWRLKKQKEEQSSVSSKVLVEESSSFSKFYSYMTQRVVKSRIRTR